MHDVVDGQDTAFRTLSPVGLGVACIAQVLPFHRSASVIRVPKVLM
jgi:hypothetical protein